MDNIKINAYAKVNLTLDVTGVRSNGYHDVAMVMQSLELHDVLTVSKRDDNEVRLSFADTEIIKGMRLSAGDDNLICAAFRKFWEFVDARADRLARAIDNVSRKTTPYGVDVLLEKNIPSEAGMGGGSADAAAMLLALNELFECGLTTEELCEIGVKIGADVPFCVLGGTALAEGIGEILTPLPQVPDALTVLLVKPPVGASTKEIYDRLVLDESTVHPDNAAMITAINEADADGIIQNLSNILEPVTISILPVIGEIKEKMLALGADSALMSGSGSTVFGIFTDRDKLKAAEKYFRSQSGLYTAVSRLI